MVGMRRLRYVIFDFYGLGENKSGVLREGDVIG